MEICDTNIEKTRAHTGKRAEKLLTKPPSRDSSPEESICQSLSGMTLEDRERQVMAEINAIKLENRIAELQAEWVRLLLSRKQRGRPTCSSPGQPFDKMDGKMDGSQQLSTIETGMGA